MQHTVERHRDGIEIASVTPSGAASRGSRACSSTSSASPLAAFGTAGVITPAEIRRIPSMFQESRSLAMARIAVILNRMVHGFASEAVADRARHEIDRATRGVRTLTGRNRARKNVRSLCSRKGALEPRIGARRSCAQRREPVSCGRCGRFWSKTTRAFRP